MTIKRAYSGMSADVKDELISKLSSELDDSRRRIKTLEERNSLMMILLYESLADGRTIVLRHGDHRVREDDFELEVNIENEPIVRRKWRNVQV